MYSSVKSISFIKRGTYDGMLFSSNCLRRIQFLRNNSGLRERKVVMLKNESVSFVNFMQQRFEEAKRSVIIQVKGSKCWKSLYDYCSAFGTIKNMFHYNYESANYILIEMQSPEEVENLLSFAQTKNNVFFQKSSFLSFEPLSVNSQVLKSNVNFEHVVLNTPISVNIDDIIKSVKEIERSTDENIMSIYNKMKIPDLGIRLRFLTCWHIQTLLSGVISSLMVYPFGSSVSGFGLNGSDLDFVILQNHNQKTEDSPLFFQTTGHNITRSLVQDHLKHINDIMKTFMVGYRNNICIKQARIPIIKFNLKYTGLDCDLSLYQSSGVAAAEVLYTLSLFDNSIKPLVFILRVWAKKIGLTGNHTYFTNYCLTVLIIFCLQQSTVSHSAVLPPLCQLSCFNNFLSNNNNSILKDEKYFEKLSRNNSLEKLLKYFFSFYAEFDFSAYGCCLRTGSIIENASESFMHIENPLEKGHNITKNISENEVYKFKYCCSVASQLLKTKENRNLFDLLNNNFYNSKDYKSRKLHSIKKISF